VAVRYKIYLFVFGQEGGGGVSVRCREIRVLYQLIQCTDREKYPNVV